MKSLTAVCQTGASMPAMKPNGRITRHPRHNRADGENAEMKMYLSKLKDLVPFMPKRKLSKLEIIQHVIDYICDLQTELEAHPEIGNFDAATALNITNHLNLQHNDEDMLTPSERLAAEAFQQQHQLQQQNQHQQQQSSQSLNSNITRQPLADRSTPNTILPPSPSSTSSSSSNSSLPSSTLTSASIITTTLLSSMPVQSQIPLTNQTSSIAGNHIRQVR